MKRGFRFGLIGVVVCCVATAGGVARAQVAVAVTSSVSITVAAGSSISNAGAFSVTNSSGSTITISSINLSVSNSSIFTSLTLTGQVPGTSAVAASSSPNPPGSSNTFDFSGLPALPTGQSATFTLSGIATNATPTPTSSSSGQGRDLAIYAGMIWPGTAGAKAPGMLLAALALGMLMMTGRMRRRHLVVLAMGLVLAATEVGCGNTNSGVTGTSTQSVQTITVSSGGTPTGLPASLGSITVQ